MCPECDEPLIAYELEGIEIDRCVVCGGTWLDTGELELIAERAGAEPGGLSDAIENAKPVAHEKRRCPRCGKKLETIILDKGEKIELERCPLGHGLWLDKGELTTVVRSFGEGEEGAVARFFEDLYRYEIEAGVKGD